MYSDSRSATIRNDRGQFSTQGENCGRVQDIILGGSYMAVYVLVKHTVEDYAKWKPVYDEDGAVRKQKGSTGATVYTVNGNANEVIVITEWPDMESAQSFAQNPELPVVMKRAGVTGHPEVYFLEKVDWQSA